MTAEEMEVAYCKARITCMKSFVRWLREHVKTSEDAQSMGISDSDNLKLTIGAMKTTEAEISKELENIRLISEPEFKAKTENVCQEDLDRNIQLNV